MRRIHKPLFLLLGLNLTSHGLAEPPASLPLNWPKMTLTASAQIGIPEINSLPSQPPQSSPTVTWSTRASALPPQLLALGMTQENPFVADKNGVLCIVPYAIADTKNNPLEKRDCEATATFPFLLTLAQQGIDLHNYNGQNWIDSTLTRFSGKTQDGARVFSNNIDNVSNSFWYVLLANITAADIAAHVGDSKINSLTKEAAIELGGLLDRYKNVKNHSLSDFRQSSISRGGLVLDLQDHQPFRYWNRTQAKPIAEDPGNDGKEPMPTDYVEAPGGIAYINYMAYLGSGENRFLSKARQGIDYIESLPDDYHPHYETVSSFTPYIAARLNAEQGGHYNVGKMIRFALAYGKSFGDSARPGWGMSTNADHRINGLIGANNTDNEYVFAMNSFISAGKLTTVARYDARFASSLARYAFNASLASQIFFSDFTPDALEAPSAIKFLNTHSKGDSVGYEGAKFNDPTRPDTNKNYLFPRSDRKEQYIAPYGTNWVGYLSGFSYPTDQSGHRMLLVDLSKTDSNRAALPGYLVQNPGNSIIKYEIRPGFECSGVWDLVKKQWISVAAQKDGKLEMDATPQTTQIIIPVPKTETIKIDGARLMAGEKVIDYHFSESPPTH